MAPPSPAEPQPYPLSAEPAPVALELQRGYSLTTRQEHHHQVLRLEAPDGRICLQITLAEDGPQLELLSTSLRIRTDGPLELHGKQLALHGEESLTFHSGGPMQLSAAGSIRVQSEGQLELEAESQRIQARSGDLTLLANDDVSVDGERIRLNSPQTAGDYAPPYAPSQAASPPAPLSVAASSKSPVASHAGVETLPGRGGAP